MGGGSHAAAAASGGAVSKRSHHRMSGEFGVREEEQQHHLPTVECEQQQQVVRETVFSSEIYEKMTTKPRQDPAVETDIVDGGDVNVTYDLMEGAGLDSGLVVKACNKSDPDTVSLNSSSCHSSADLSSLGGSGGVHKNVIGGVTIAEYEGSPRRYRPRKHEMGGDQSGEVTSSGKKQSSSSKRRGAATGSRSGGGAQGVGASSGPKMPGFPQRVLPAAVAAEPAAVPTASSSSSSSSPSLNSSGAAQRRKKEAAGSPSSTTTQQVLVKFEDATPTSEAKGGAAASASGSSAAETEPETVAGRETGVVAATAVASKPPATALGAAVVAASSSGSSTPRTKDGGYDYQYEFSETRKVLDEFFTSDTTIKQAAAPIATVESSRRLPAPEENFMDLNYTLTRRSANGGSRQQHHQAASNGYACQTSGQAGQAPEGNPAEAASAAADILQLHHPQVGLSPLDHQPPMIVGKAVAALSSSDVTISTSSSVTTTGGKSNGTDTGYATLNSPDSVRHNLAAAQTQPSASQSYQQAPPHSQPLSMQQSQHPKSAVVGGGVNPPQRGAQQQQHVEFSRVLQTVHDSSGALSSSTSATLVPTGPGGNPAAAPAGSAANAVGGGAAGADCSRNFTLSPETTDCDSADLESEVSMNEGSYHSSGPRMHTSMPVLEDGLSSGHASDLEDDVVYSR